MIGNFKQITAQKLQELQANPSMTSQYIYEDSEYNHLDIDKTWQAIHWLLTGEEHGGDGILAKAILGGTEIGDDVGYGPAMYLTPEEVKQVSSELEKITPDQLISRYDGEAMSIAALYPRIWDRKEEEQINKDYILENYPRMVEYYQGAARAGNGMLIYIN